MSSMSKRLLSSSAGTKSDQEEDDDLEDGFSELENSKSGQESTTSSSDESDVDEGKLSADEEEELELDLTETDDSRKTLEKKQSELFKAIVSAGGLSVGSALDKWVEEEGNEISRTDVAKAMLQLRRRRMYGRALQVNFTCCCVDLDVFQRFCLCFLFSYRCQSGWRQIRRSK